MESAAIGIPATVTADAMEAALSITTNGLAPTLSEPLPSLQDRILARIRAEISKKQSALPTCEEYPDDSFHRFFISPKEFTCGSCINNDLDYCTEYHHFILDENKPACIRYCHNWRF